MRKQLSLNSNNGRHGGRRTGAGRARLRSKGVAHRPRELVNLRVPLHINFKFRTFIITKQSLKLLKRAILNARSHGLKILHYSMQTNHIHLIIEAVDNDILTRGMRSLTVTFAKGLKQGRVQIERYHLHVLRTLQEARNAIRYVLFNKQKHQKGTCSTVDEYTSVMGLQNALQLIKNFATLKRMMLTTTRSMHEVDLAASYLARIGLNQLIS